MSGTDTAYGTSRKAPSGPLVPPLSVRGDKAGAETSVNFWLPQLPQAAQHAPQAALEQPLRVEAAQLRGAERVKDPGSRYVSQAGM
eukprot:3084307-Rhodomonas_salina.1